jgi:hypothetical protein
MNLIILFAVEAQDTENGMLLKDVNITSTLLPDSANNYKKVGHDYAFHGMVDHQKPEYIKDKVIHANTFEGAVRLFDRMVIGISHNISQKHMQSYCNESAYRYNEPKSTDPFRL